MLKMILIIVNKEWFNYGNIILLKVFYLPELEVANSIILKLLALCIMNFLLFAS